MKNYHEPSPAIHGFTLVEISIVLVILGLIAGGILIAQDLTRDGKLRGITADLAKYETAVITFRDKYQALPGDFAGATAIWGSAGGTGSDVACQNTIGAGTATCDGNADGIVMTSAVLMDESYRAWQHLANAGFVDGLFTGTTNGLALSDMLVRVLPAAKMNNIGYQFITDSKTNEGWTNPPEAGTMVAAIRVAAPYTGGTPLRLGDNALSSFDVGTIDEKLDDGKPGLGKIYVQANSATATCITTTDATTSNYIMTNENDLGCFFHYTY